MQTVFVQIRVPMLYVTRAIMVVALFCARYAQTMHHVLGGRTQHLRVIRGIQKMEQNVCVA